MMKKLVATLLMLMLCVAFTVTAACAETYNGTTGDCTWTFDSATGTLTISGSGAMAAYTSSSMPWAAYKDNITSVVIEDGVTSIGNYAFSNCSCLTTVTIEGSIETIGSNAFSNCSCLTTICYYGINPPKAGTLGRLNPVIYVSPNYAGEKFCRIPVLCNVCSSAGHTHNAPCSICGHSLCSVNHDACTVAYTITYVLDGGTINGEYATSYAFGDGVSLPQNVTRDGYYFAGWYDAAEGGNGPLMAFGRDKSGDLTVYARWTPKTYTVVWRNDDYTVLEKDENVPYGTRPTYDGETPTKAAPSKFRMPGRWNRAMKKSS